MAILRYNPQAQPIATILLVAMNAVIAIADAFSGGQIERALWGRGVDVYYGQWWRLASCTVVHANFMHVAFNCYGIFLLGGVLERLQGWRAVLVVYCVSAIGGSALGLAFNDPYTPMLGASGAAYGLMGAVLGFFYVKTGSIRGIWQTPFSRQLAVWFLIGMAISMGPGISLLGHLGGFVPGVLLGIYYEHRYVRRTDAYHHASAALLVALVLAFAVYATYPWHRGNLAAGRALAAFERGDIAGGDALLARARDRGTTAGGSRLLEHLTNWRKFKRPADIEVLRWPLTHRVEEPGLRGGWWDMLQDEDVAELAPVNTP